MQAALDLIFLCAGRGTRVGMEVPKQFLTLGGRPVMVHSLAVFDRLSVVGTKIIVHEAGEAERIEEILVSHGITNWMLTPGGASRQESVRLGLALVTSERVFTHNAAVPFLTPEMLERVRAVEADCVTTASEVNDNLVRVEAGHELHPVPRTGLRIINSPQIFRTEAFRRAHEKAHREALTFNSDTELMLHYGHEVRLVGGPSWSFKITDRLDLALAETMLARPDLFPALDQHEAPQNRPAEPASALG